MNRDLRSFTLPFDRSTSRRGLPAHFGRYRIGDASRAETGPSQAPVFGDGEQTERFARMWMVAWPVFAKANRFAK
jgi:hypothetical protein